MFNLVQLQERLKDVPIQSLMQYANGANPQIPPFIALGELNRRKKMQESAAAEQAQQMEGAPTVKEQIEQATGLLALQGARQQQAAQQQAGAQANTPMPAPNTMTSEPAQMASGGAVDDVVMPRDYQRGGMAAVANPEMLKRLMLLKAMQQRQPQAAGINRLPMRPDMFARKNYAGGGIVAFARGGLYGEEEDEEKRSAADVINQALGQDQVQMTPEELVREALRRRQERPSRTEALEAAGLNKVPDLAAQQIAALEAERQRQRESDTVMNRLLAVDPRRLGQSMYEYGTKQAAAQSAIENKIAQARDLQTKAQFEYDKGNFEAGRKDEEAADKMMMDAGTKISEIGYKESLGEQAGRGKVTNFSQLMEIIDEAKKNPTPENIRRMQSAITASAYVTYQGPRVEATERATEAGNERVAVKEYADLFDPKKMLFGALSDEMDAAEAKDKKAGGGTFYQDQIRLREYNRIRESLRLPPASSLPGSGATRSSSSSGSSKIQGFSGREIPTR